MKNWTIIANEIDGRTAKQCRERWCNHLDPSIIKGNWTEEEDALILQRQKEMGNKWSKISKMLLGRTENAVKVRWKALDRAAKKAIALAKLGVDASKKNNANRSSNRRRSSKKKTKSLKSMNDSMFELFADKETCSKTCTKFLSETEHIELTKHVNMVLGPNQN